MACLATAAFLACAGCRRHDFPDYPQDYREYAYVTNSGSGSVSVIDVTNLRPERVLTVGANPTGVAANPQRNEVYVVNTGSNSVSVIDSASNAVTATIPVHQQPYFIDVSRDGTRGYVANSKSNDVSVLDLPARRQIAIIGVGEAPGYARIAPDGNALVVTNTRSGSVSVVDPHTNRVRSIFSNCPGATDAVMVPDSSRALVACSAGHQVMVIGLARSNGLDSEHRDRLLTFLDVGRTPVSIALKPDGGEAFAVNFDSNSISEIVTSTSEVGGAYAIGVHPSRGIVSSDNAALWVANFGAGTVSLYSIDDGKLIMPPVHVGEGPDALALSSEGHLLFVVDTRSSDLAVVRTASRSLLTLLPTGVRPSSIAIKAFRSR